ncbi:plant UBX domain-containing protein 10-like protein [Tanacetum coccineum]
MSNPLAMLEASCNGLVRRMVRLPQTISRAVDQGLELMRNRPQYLPPNVPFHHNQHPPLDHSNHNYFQPGLGFLATFEQQYGLVHPFFYACRFEEVLKMAQDEHKFVFLYLHSPNHPFTPPFCKDTLCSEVVVQFLDTNFVSWGGVVDRDEGLHLATTLRPTIFPFCAVVARGLDGSLTVAQQMEGPMSPEELVEILQTTLEEQGLACDNRREKEEEKRRADIRLRQEQDAAYAESLQADQEKESKLIRKKHRHQDNATQNAKDAKIVIRFPNGERKEKTFSDLDKIEAIFRFIDSLGLPGVAGNYKLVSTFPRKVYGIDCTKMKLKDAGFYPEATLFIEFV